jgi:rhodanese-related sulfurtransferase
VVIVDTRPSEKVKGGHIPGAYGFPFAEYEWTEYALPLSKRAPIIIYSDDPEEIDAAVKATRGWGYSRAVGFYDGLKRWKEAGYELEKGKAAFADVDNVIAWERKLGPGQISISDFEDSLESALIKVIDVRTPMDYEAGHFPGAINIPLDEVKSRMEDIPKNKFIVVHCQTGARGEIAYNVLRDAGYAVKYLEAECKCDPQGNYEIW